MCDRPLSLTAYNCSHWRIIALLFVYYYSDLKPANIGFDRAGKVKIFDFGLAREYDEDLEGKNLHKPRFMTGGAGTPRYMAPEVARMDDDYGFPADVYSFSILLWQIVTHRTPYKKITTTAQFDTRVVKKHQRPSLSYVENAQLKNLLEAGWCPHPQERPSFSSIRQSLELIISRKKSKSKSKRRLLVPHQQQSRTGQSSGAKKQPSVDDLSSSVASTVNSEPISSLRSSMRRPSPESNLYAAPLSSSVRSEPVRPFIRLSHPTVRRAKSQRFGGSLYQCLD